MRRPPKQALVILLGFLLLGNVLSAAAPDYLAMLVGRMIAALAHGGYFGIGAVLAGALVAPARKASAVAVSGARRQPGVDRQRGTLPEL